jgi:hypothetical protein
MRALLLLPALILAVPTASGQAPEDAAPSLRLLIEVFDAESGDALPAAHAEALDLGVVDAAPHRKRWGASRRR